MRKTNDAIEPRKTNNTIEPLSVDIATAAELTSIGRTRLYELINDGTIPSKTIGRRRVIPYAALKALVA